MATRERVQIHVLGPIQASDGALVELGRPANVRLLAILALDAGLHISTDALVDRFWPDRPPPTAKASIQTHMSALRRALGKKVVATEGHGYRLDTDVAIVDASRFLELAGQVSNSVSTRSWSKAVRAADQALEMWRGPPYPELIDDDFARPAIGELTETHLQLLEMRSEALLALDRAADALPELESLTVEHPFRELLWEHLMTARYRLGRHTEALHAYQEVSEKLAAIGLQPGARLRRLEERVLLQDSTLATTRNNLPVELSSFVGRDREIDNVSRLMEDQRLVTLVGPGGSGKTRLALRVAREVIDRFPDGVWVVELAATQDATLVATEIALALGLKPKGADALDVIVSAIAEHQTLIILDNCEHLLPSAATTAQRLLEQASDLRILTTSRESLRLPGESIYEVPGMEHPLSPHADLRQASDFEAVQLFVQRAKAVSMDFAATQDNLAAVARVCGRLDGMPLAIELAAARVRSMTVEMIAERLDDQLALLTRGASTAPLRHRTLQATIEWSYRLLRPEEQKVLNRLGVFRGTFDLNAAEHVASGPNLAAGEVTAIISDLVEKSLVNTHGRRYRLLETVRQYARIQLDVSGEMAAVEDRHVNWCLGTLEGLWDKALGSGMAVLIGDLDVESDNLQAALERAKRKQDSRAVVVLSQAAAWHWYFAGHLDNTNTTLQSAFEIVDDRGEMALMRALLARSLAYSEDIDGAMVEAEAAHRLNSELESPLYRAWVVATVQLVLFMSVKADPASMLTLAAEAEEIASSGETYAEVFARQTMADAYCWNGRTQEGLSQQRLAIDLAVETGDLMTIDYAYGLSIYNLMLDPVSRRDGPMEAARAWLSIVQPSPDSIMSTATDWLPWIYMQAGDLDRADEAASWLGNRFQEGYNRTIFLMVTASLSWMRGNLKEARRTVDELAEGGVSERWTHVYYPLAAEIFADQGRLEDVVDMAAEYLSMDIHPSGEAAKLGVLNPLVRAEVDAAIEGDSEVHAARAGQALDRMRQILEDTPPLTEGSTSVMTPLQNLAFAEAELRRLSEPSPDLWAKVLDLADYAYFRLYARWRWAEALLQAGDIERGTALLREADDEVTAMGAQLMRTRVKRTAREFQVPL